jgi:hypothetical protein
MDQAGIRTARLETLKISDLLRSVYPKEEIGTWIIRHEGLRLNYLCEMPGSLNG